MTTPRPLPMATSSLPASEEGAGGVWQVSVQFGQDVLRNGLDPVSFIRYLGTVGQLQDVCMDAERLPGLERMDAEACYLGFNMTVSGVNDRQTIEDVFEFVRDDCALSITPLNHARQSSSSQGDTPTDSQVAVAEDSATGSAGQALPAAEATGAAAHGTRAKASSGKPARFIRVNAEKLDGLIHPVGELVIAGASGALLARQFGNAALQEATASI